MSRWCTCGTFRANERLPDVRLVHQEHLPALEPAPRPSPIFAWCTRSTFRRSSGSPVS